LWKVENLEIKCLRETLCHANTFSPRRSEAGKGFFEGFLRGLRPFAVKLLG